jgi:pimeloyl-ACP methyl ester carboxylesterase
MKIIFIHHYGGDKGSFGRTYEFLESLGHEVVRFTLPVRRFQELRQLPLGEDGSIGLRHIWADAITDVLESNPGPKIVMSMSYPSVAALEAINRHPRDVLGWICEGGPFAQVTRGYRNYIEYFKCLGLLTFLEPLAAWLFAVLVGNLHYTRDACEALGKLSGGFPILSLRDGADELVQEDMIDAFFALGAEELNLKTVRLPNAGHLEGLKKAPEIYKTTLSNFLRDCHALRSGQHD